MPARCPRAGALPAEPAGLRAEVPQPPARPRRPGRAPPRVGARPTGRQRSPALGAAGPGRAATAGGATGPGRRRQPLCLHGLFQEKAL